MKRLLHLLRNSVRGRLALLVLAITAPAVLLVGLLVFQAYRNERQVVAEHLIATARAISALVDSEIDESQALLKVLATSQQLRTADFVGFRLRAEAVMSGANGWIELSDAGGRLLASTGPPDVPITRVREPEELEATSAGGIYVSNMPEGGDISRRLVRVVLPVAEAGRLKYTLSHVLTPSVFAHALRTGRFSSDSVISILDRKATIVSRHPNGEQFTGEKAMPDVIEAILTRTEGTHLGKTLEGVSVLAVYCRSPLTGWTVAMGVPLATLHKSALRLLVPGLATSALLLAVAIFMTMWIGRALVRSVDTLVKDTERMGTGIVPPVRDSGLEEMDFISEAMRKSALQVKERDDENSALASALQSELELKRRSEESSRRLAAIVESSDDAIVSKNLDGTVTSWNRSAERLFGYTATEMIGRPISLLIPREREHEGPQILERIKRGERVEHFETFRLRKDGVLVPISLTVSPIYDHSGRIVGASKISRDISQRYRADLHQHALYELVARVNRAEALPEIYDAALDAMGQCIEADRASILLSDTNGVMRFVAARRLSETYRKAVEGHSPWLTSETDPKPVWVDDVATASLDTELRKHLVAEGIRALAFVPLTYEKRLLGKFMIYFDRPHTFTVAELRPVETIARQVAFAIERQRDAEALETLVNERTASLRQVMAQMEEFSYTVSHDLRAPVRAMRGYADIILQDHGWRLDNEARELLTRIVRGGARMDRLIQDLLTYSRVSRRELQLEPVSLDKLVREVV